MNITKNIEENTCQLLILLSLNRRIPNGTYGGVRGARPSAPSTRLTYTHYKILLPLKNVNEIDYYINITISQNLSIRQLQTRIKSKEYERIDEETKNKLINNEELEIKDMIKNPIVIKNKYDTTKISEKMLTCLILEDIEAFMKELGSGYTFVGSEYKIKIRNSII